MRSPPPPGRVADKPATAPATPPLPRRRYGLYSSRGVEQCGTDSYRAIGSLGYEAADVKWMLDAGADCEGSGRGRPTYPVSRH